MGSAEDPSRRQEIQSSLKSIVESSEKWLGRLKRREFRVRLATSFLTTILVFFAVGAIYLSFVIILYGWPHLISLFHDPSQAALLASTIFLGGMICGIATYFLLKRKRDAQLKKLSSLIFEMKKWAIIQVEDLDLFSTAPVDYR